MELHERLGYFRQKSGLTQKQLGLLIGKSVDTVRKYESGKVEPRWTMLVKIARILGVNILALLPITSTQLFEELDRREEFVNEFYGG